MLDGTIRSSVEGLMASHGRSVATALTLAVLFSSGCSGVHERRHADRTIRAMYSLWDGMGPPKGDAAFLEARMCRHLTISTVDVAFTLGTAPGGATALHQRTAGALAYGEMREIRVTRRRELLILSRNAGARDCA